MMAARRRNRRNVTEFSSICNPEECPAVIQAVQARLQRPPYRGAIFIGFNQPVEPGVLAGFERRWYWSSGSGKCPEIFPGQEPHDFLRTCQVVGQHQVAHQQPAGGYALPVNVQVANLAVHLAHGSLVDLGIVGILSSSGRSGAGVFHIWHVDIDHPSRS